VSEKMIVLSVKKTLHIAGVAGKPHAGEFLEREVVLAACGGR